MVDLINTLREVNIVTIEDPIEVLHSDKKAIVSQREVRFDTADFNSALRCDAARPRCYFGGGDA